MYMIFYEAIGSIQERSRKGLFEAELLSKKQPDKIITKLKHSELRNGFLIYLLFMGS